MSSKAMASPGNSSCLTQEESVYYQADNVGAIEDLELGLDLVIYTYSRKGDE